MPGLQKVLNYLFVSKVRIKTLKYFYQNTNTEIHLPRDHSSAQRRD